MPTQALQYIHPMKGLDAVADAFASTVYSDIYNMGDYSSILFILHKGVGTTGTSTLTVQACDDISASNTTDIPFRSKSITATDVEGALTVRAAAGFDTTAGSSQIYAIEASSEEMEDTGYQYIRLAYVEVADAAVLGGILAFGIGNRYKQDVPATAVV